MFITVLVIFALLWHNEYFSRKIWYPPVDQIIFLINRYISQLSIFEFLEHFFIIC